MFSVEVFEKTSQEIIEVCKRLHHQNFLAAADGNISCRLDTNHIAITPSGVPKAFIEAHDIAIMRLDGSVVQGKPSSEKLMHLAIYQQCAAARCVIHAHPPTAIAWSIAHPQLKELPANCMSELILAVGRVPFVSYARPGSQAMGDVLQAYLPTHRVMILSRHGGLAWGESLTEAMNGMERLEHTAQILMYAVQLGGLTFLPDQEVEALYEMRRQIGERIL
jgi:L-fuculose-phosphate aldolase